MNCCVVLSLLFLNSGCSGESSALNADSGQDSGESNSASSDHGADADAMDGAAGIADELGGGTAESAGANDCGEMDGGAEGLVDGAATGGTDATQNLMSGVHEWVVSQEIDGQAVERRVLIHGPKKFQEGSRYPVVIAFHGNGGNQASGLLAWGPSWTKRASLASILRVI
ncbi:MAG TPA: hypothetical protein EYN06_02995 [Myxococcales bacterium]|nr:hypothetical protein [Myxococcales bacterium]HIN85422.1 hypothetical protein [Myxococcales bacterium]